jgi:hypothetical protein
MIVGTLAAACTHGGPSLNATAQLDGRYCAAVRAWFAADELQQVAGVDEPEDHVHRLDAVRSTFVALAQEYRQAARSDVSVQITRAADLMRDYAAALTEPFAANSGEIFLSVYGALRETGISCPSPIFDTPQEG